MQLFKRQFAKPFWKFFFSYLVVLCIPIIILVSFFYSTVISQFQDMTYKTQLAEQQKQSERMDAMLDELKSISIQFSSHNISIASLGSNVLTRMELMQRLQGLLALNTSLSDVIFWVPQQELFYTSKSTYSSGSYATFYNIDLAATLQKELAYRQTVSTLTCNLFTGRAQNSEYLYYSCPYPYKSTLPGAYLVFRIETSKFIAAQPGSYALRFQDKVLVDQLGQAPADGTLPIDTHDRSKTYITTASAGNGLLLTTVIDNKVLFASFYRTRNMFLLCTVLVFGLCVFLLSRFSSKNAKPINELNQMLVKLGVVSEDAVLKSSETSRTIEYMEKLTNENRQLDSRLLEEKFVSRGLWLSKLLNGQPQYLPDILPHLEKYGIHLMSNWYTVALVYVDTEVQDNPFFDQFLFRDEHFELYYYLDAQNKIYVLIGADNDYANALTALASSIVGRFAAIDIRCEIFMGSTFRGVGSIHNAHTSALSSVNDEITYMGKVHLPSENSTSQLVFYPRVELDSLQSALMEGDVAQFGQVLDGIIFQMQHSCYRDFWYKGVCYEIVNIIIRNYVTDENRDTVLQQINHFLSELGRTSLRQDIIHLLQGFTAMVRKDAPKQAGHNPQQKLIDEMIDYIGRHYTDPEFFLGKLSQRFNLSPNNLSQQLKRALGMAPAKYINTLRVGDAKALLATSDYTIRQVGQKVGFQDVSTFIRNFRVQTGMSPGQYREMHAKKENC